jgi:PEGA domain
LVAEVSLDVDAVGAEIYVDGDLEGQAPLPGTIYLAPGAHELEARKDGKSATSQVNATAGQTTSVRLRLAAAAVPRPPVGEGASASPSAPSPEEEKPAREREGFVPWLTSTPGAMIGAGLTGVGLIGGGAFALGSKSAYDAADSVADQIKEKAELTDGKRVAGQINGQGACLDPESWLSTSDRWGTQRADVTDAQRKDRAAQYVDNCNKYSDNVKSGDTFKTLAIVSFAVASAAAVGTIVYYFVDADTKPVDQASRGPRLVVLPIYQPGFAGGLVSGSF